VIPLHRKILTKALEFFDLIIIVCAFGLATVATYHRRVGVMSFQEFLAMRVKVQNIAIFIGFMFLWHLIFSLFGMYQSRRLSSRWKDAMDVLKATSLGCLGIWIFSLCLRIDIVTPAAVFLPVFWVSSSSAAIASRLALRNLLERIRRRGRNLRYVLIAGTNSRAIEFARKIEAKSELGYRLLGFVDDQWYGTDEFRKNGYSLLVDFNDLPAFLREHVVDEVVIALPINSSYHKASRVVALCEEQGIIVRFLSNIFNPKLAWSRAELIEDESMIALYTGAMEGWPVVAKRVLDFCVSLSLLIILSPIFLLAAILIKLTSPGPVFFIQERVGLNKRRFNLYKFRSMVPDAEEKLATVEHLNEVTGPVFKITEDPRITSIGKFLRKTSIDELPQLFNVLNGNMSLVGPRPLPVRDYQGFDQDWLRRRFSVRPGITCLWQINGRSSIPFNQWMELDMRYIDEWSLSLDLKILAKTIPAVIKGSGAA
jgi:exopolysaccharide biosynthesis polyprenyl glycosylphosphotransferase